VTRQLAEQIQIAARRYLDGDRFIRVVFRPEAAQ